VNEPCSDCGGGPVGRYCSECGQRRLTDHDLTTAGFLRETFHELTSFDGRLWQTLRLLLTRPGLLAREYFDGRGGRYMKPLNLFVLLNLVFFLIQPHTGLLQYSLANFVEYDGDVAARRMDLVNGVRLDRAMRAEALRERRGLPSQPIHPEEYEVFRARFDDVLQDQMKSMLIVCIPLLALAMLPLYAGRRRRYAEHLVFSVHAYAFFLFFAGVLVTPLFLVTYLALKKLGLPQSSLGFLNTQGALIVVLFVAIGGYLYLGLRLMYADSRVGAALRATVLFVVMQGLILVYHDALFRTTLAAL
jgi:Protein of unknown function (DUF3667)